uniref:ribonuclease Z n=1 Tax=Ditylenchus dipsaci TaxID=166011 RepID=A0A915DVR3_9BILA
MSSKKMKLDSENGKSSSAKAASFASLEQWYNSYRASVVLKTDKNTYIFNCPEGTCRFQSAMRLRPNTTYDFFITRGSWDCFGGVSASLLSKADLGLSLPQECRLHGPKNIRQYLDDLRPFLDSDKSFDKYSMLMEERNYERGSYQDEILSVQYIPLMIELAKPPMKVDFFKVIELKIPPAHLLGSLKTEMLLLCLMEGILSQNKSMLKLRLRKDRRNA